MHWDVVGWLAQPILPQIPEHKLAFLHPSEGFTVILDVSVTFGITESGEVTVNDATVATTGSRGGALFVLSGTIRHYLAEHAPDLVFIHAGVVVWEGRALLLPGRSMAGKSTLVRLLNRLVADRYED